jgi:BUD22
LDHELIAIEMLSRRLRKDKHIQANDQVKAVVSEELETPSMPNAEANRAILGILEGRISSSKVLAGPVGDLVAALRALVLPRKMENTEPQLEPADIVTDSEEQGDDGWESGSVLVDHQINGDTNDGRESENREGPPLAPPQVKTRTLIPKTTTSGGNDSTPGELISSMHANGTSDETKDTSFDVDTGNSAFIPTLAVGYTRGDSSASDWSGGDGSDDEKIDPKPRKNRRGQRARKA